MFKDNILKSMADQRLTLNCRGRLLNLQKPIVMGILNITPDSFYDGGKFTQEEAIKAQVNKMIAEGACIIDVGGMSSRPGAELIEETTEKERVIPVIKMIAKTFPDTLISIDTIRANIAREAVEEGAHIVNDISAGRLDKEMYATIASLKVPYILMHMSGKPEDMQKKTSYGNVVRDILSFLTFEIQKLRELGVIDIIIDPGFGFGKTIAQNYSLLNHLHAFQMLDCPILAGISRKSMIYKLLEIKPEQALNGTSALHMIALQQGARILRVHDVQEAVQVIELYEMVKKTAHL